MSDSEVQTLQTRYRQLQNAIEKCNGDIAEERHMQTGLREESCQSQNESQYKAQMHQCHDKLTRVEAKLGEVMTTLESEHGASCKLLAELDQEEKIAEMVAEKIRKHEGFVERSSNHNTSVEAVMAQRHEELQELKNQIAKAQVEYEHIEEDYQAELASAEAVQSKLSQEQV